MAGAGSKCTSIIDRIRIIFFLDGDHLCFAVGGVSGKGVPVPLFVAVHFFTPSLSANRVIRSVARVS